MDIVCLSHLRWNFVFQRPQHLLSRAGRDGRVLYVEEPIAIPFSSRMEIGTNELGVTIARPALSHRLSQDDQLAVLRGLLDDAISRYVSQAYVLWYSTPTALPFSDHLRPWVTVYDCMEDLVAQPGDAAGLRSLEDALFNTADLVFADGQSLYETARLRHHNVQLFPSGVDATRVERSRSVRSGAADQQKLPRPRIGFSGVLDDRVDYELLRDIADARPGWQLILVGPIADIDPFELPQAPNLHYLGPKLCGDLPAYIAGWDVAILPFAGDEARRVVVRTRTPEYLAAGKPVVSTPIRDVVKPFGEHGLARIADNTSAFVAAIEDAMREDPLERALAADAFLSDMSWDRTWQRMRTAIQRSAARARTAGPRASVSNAAASAWSAGSSIR
jgi:UDP-galactopyranose mutase